ncbi:hypothetical protein GCM10022226_41140 [Sphaerisporangium flaviroseum]|uniref:Uncharacterized protein n=1 Tax=Sphaerisporangium flaviroseum TaxID=509199 RepID=A0ABP7IE09_9ACTN
MFVSVVGVPERNRAEGAASSHQVGLGDVLARDPVITHLYLLVSDRRTGCSRNHRPGGPKCCKLARGGRG